ncbi:Alcohol dehydrogenase 4 [Hondaea fermentalgiana]|uniref:Alcohol dehydrogenase 4 n=1 Tax=Hondaea fermentalgiana TaxID=2315210 RepID=A0A2R5GVM9_9STRA|nr:Alcohol dehydrogenase 4 [Hondaea fermentalgiana]|eukprot:GBG32461.1 Alcohol dehydrogenase 4 [Hondaea fermentalgiana]
MTIMHKLKSELGRQAMSRIKYEKFVPDLENGPGSAKRAGEVARRLGITKTLIVTDKILVDIGLVGPINNALQNAGTQTVIFDGVLPDPTVAQIEDGAEFYIANGCDGIIAIGGGSAMDCAKMIGAVVSNNKPPAAFAGAFKVRKRIPALIAVPTTHGTGSEVTFAAVVSDPVAQRKLLVSDFKIVPRVAILDPELLTGLPPAISAATGMDALTHAVESYLSPWATSYSLEKSRSAVKGVFDFILRAYHDGESDLEAREGMLLASFNAGIGISCGAVGYVHAIAHTLGYNYHTPHGVANAMILPHVLRFYGDAAAPRLAELARLVGLSTTGNSDEDLARLFIDRICEMQREMHMPTTVQGLRADRVDDMATIALQEAHGERHSMLFRFGEFMMDTGYPTIKHMTHGECARIVRHCVAPPSSKL